MKYFALLLLFSSIIITSLKANAEQNKEYENISIFESKIKCNDAIETSIELNSFDLFGASINCFKDEQEFEATFLVIIGQIRAVTDMSLLAAAEAEDQLIQADLYGILFYQMGGAGRDELYRDYKQRNTLFNKINKWSPNFTSEYDPGWKYKEYSKTNLYKESIKKQKEHRIAQLKNYASLISNNEYYYASKELSKLQTENPEGFVEGTDDYQRARELNETMQQIADVIPSAEFKSSKPYSFEPAPDADYEQLYVGFNGPKKGGTYIWETEVDARGSWLADALTETEITDVISKVNFEEQMLVAFVAGERPNVTGKVYITEITYNSILKSLSIVGRVGVNEKDCKYDHALSYAFALAVAKRTPEIPLSPGYNVANFGDGCKQPKSGEPNG